MAAIHEMFENMPNRKRYKIIRDDVINVLTKLELFQDLANLVKALIKFGLKMSLHKCQFLEIY